MGVLGVPAVLLGVSQTGTALTGGRGRGQSLGGPALQGGGAGQGVGAEVGLIILLLLQTSSSPGLGGGSKEPGGEGGGGGGPGWPLPPISGGGAVVSAARRGRLAVDRGNTKQKHSYRSCWYMDEVCKKKIQKKKYIYTVYILVVGLN